jgi:ferredoxin
MVQDANSPTIGRSFVKLIPMIVLIAFAAMQAVSATDMQMNIATALAVICTLIIFFLIIHTKKTDTYRTILFISIAWMFPLGFIAGALEERGHFMVLTAEDMLVQRAKFCTIGVTQNVFPLLFKNEAFFPIEASQVVFQLIIVIGFGLMIGRGWCAWACFWGGWEEGFALVRKKAAIKKINPKFRFLPFAVLVSTAFLSASLFTSFYCFWLCPFKAVSEFVEIRTQLIVVQTVIFLAIFLVLVIVLPILTKKRTQCTFFCPFGAFMSFFHKINPFEIRIDPTKCNKCQKCIRVCPVLAITPETLEKGKTTISCTRCARCIDQCPKGAMAYHIRGTKLFVNSELKRLLFLYPTFFMTAFIGVPAIQQFFYRIAILLSTGSFIR